MNIHTALVMTKQVIEDWTCVGSLINIYHASVLMTVDYTGSFYGVLGSS
jgi:hypothetical protein